MDVVYCSHTGYTREYAQLLGRAERLRVYSLEEAKNQLEPGCRERHCERGSRQPRRHHTAAKSSPYRQPRY